MRSGDMGSGLSGGEDAAECRDGELRGLLVLRAGDQRNGATCPAGVRTNPCEPSPMTCCFILTSICASEVSIPLADGLKEGRGLTGW